MVPSNLVNSFLQFLGVSMVPGQHERCIAILEARSADALREWETRGFALSRIDPLLSILQDGMDYPNRFFLPDDRLQTFVNDDTYDFSVFEIFEEIKLAYPENDPDVLNLSEEATIGDFANAILKSFAQRENSSLG